MCYFVFVILGFIMEIQALAMLYDRLSLAEVLRKDQLGFQQVQPVFFGAKDHKIILPALNISSKVLVVMGKCLSEQVRKASFGHISSSEPIYHLLAIFLIYFIILIFYYKETISNLGDTSIFQAKYSLYKGILLGSMSRVLSSYVQFQLSPTGIIPHVGYIHDFTFLQP